MSACTGEGCLHCAALPRSERRDKKPAKFPKVFNKATLRSKRKLERKNRKAGR